MQGDLLQRYDQAAGLIAASQRPLLICHVAPDGDAIGSLLGLASILRALGKNATTASQDGVPKNLRFLPGSQRIVVEPPDQADLVIALDCSDLERLGTVYDRALYESIPLLNIDHHVTNLLFGSVNVVPDATSTAEVAMKPSTTTTRRSWAACMTAPTIVAISKPPNAASASSGVLASG